MIVTDQKSELKNRPKLLDEVRQLALERYGQPEPVDRHVAWAKRFILFHEKRHPRDLDIREVARFLDHIVKSEKDPLNALDQAREALSFLYEEVLSIPIGELPMPKPPMLLDRLRHAIRVRHYSPRTESCYVEWTLRYLLGHERLETTMIYTHVARKGPAGVTSPLDLLGEWCVEEVRKAVAATERLGKNNK